MYLLSASRCGFLQSSGMHKANEQTTSALQQKSGVTTGLGQQMTCLSPSAICKTVLQGTHICKWQPSSTLLLVWPATSIKLAHSSTKSMITALCPTCTSKSVSTGRRSCTAHALMFPQSNFLEILREQTVPVTRNWYATAQQCFTHFELNGAVLPAANPVTSIPVFTGKRMPVPNSYRVSSGLSIP